MASASCSTAARWRETRAESFSSPTTDARFHAIKVHKAIAPNAARTIARPQRRWPRAVPAGEGSGWATAVTLAGSPPMAVSTGFGATKKAVHSRDRRLRSIDFRARAPDHLGPLRAFPADQLAELLGGAGGGFGAGRGELFSERLRRGRLVDLGI